MPARRAASAAGPRRAGVAHSTDRRRSASTAFRARGSDCPSAAMPAMRAPPLSVCRWRLSSSTIDAAPIVPLTPAHSMSAVSPRPRGKMLGDSSVEDRGDLGVVFGRESGLDRRRKGSGLPRPPARQAAPRQPALRHWALCGTSGRAVRAASMMRCSSSSAMCSMSASSAICDWKKPVDSISPTDVAIMQSASSQRAARRDRTAVETLRPCDRRGAGRIDSVARLGNMRELPRSRSPCSRCRCSVWQARCSFSVNVEHGSYSLGFAAVDITC